MKALIHEQFRLGHRCGLALAALSGSLWRIAGELVRISVTAVSPTGSLLLLDG